MAAQCSNQKQINSSDDEVLWEIDRLLHMRARRFETTKNCLEHGFFCGGSHGMNGKRNKENDLKKKKIIIPAFTFTIVLRPGLVAGPVQDLDSES